MKHHYVLSRPWLSSGSDGLVEDYAINLTDNVIIEKYGFLFFIRFDSKVNASDSLSVTINSISFICLTINLILGLRSSTLRK